MNAPKIDRLIGDLFLGTNDMHVGFVMDWKIGFVMNASVVSVERLKQHHWGTSRSHKSEWKKKYLFFVKSLLWSDNEMKQQSRKRKTFQAIQHDDEVSAGNQRTDQNGMLDSNEAINGRPSRGHKPF